MTLNDSSQSEWQLQTAKAQFSQVVNRAMESGPQLITKAGRPAVYVISAEMFETEFRSKAKDRKSILLSSPHQDTFLNLDRDQEEGREVTL